MMGKPGRVLLTPVAIVVVWVVRWLARHGWCIRFGDLWSSRLGHMVGNNECYLAEREAGMHDTVKGDGGATLRVYDIWYSQRVRANKYIENKYRAALRRAGCGIWPGEFVDLVARVNRLSAGYDRHEVASAQFDRDIHNLWVRPHIGLSESELKRGERLLRGLGIPQGGKWVCLMVRDGAYLREQGKRFNAGADFSYHNYRDSDVGTYSPAVVELLRRGYYVVRMGVNVEKPLLIKHSRFIDYAWNGLRTEFGDLYLGAKCEFCLGTSTGFTILPQLFHRPIVMVNYAPLEYGPTFYDKVLLIWKHHVREGKRMTLAEIFAVAGQFTYAHQYREAGITLEDNTPVEIFDATVEMADALESGQGVPFKGTQPEFWSQFPLGAISPYNGKRLHGKAKMRIGREFLKGYSG